LFSYQRFLKFFSLKPESGDPENNYLFNITSPDSPLPTSLN
jgi:hypothetical protein